jgi:hypothetical protein
MLSLDERFDCMTFPKMVPSVALVLESIGDPSPAYAFCEGCTTPV